jgi:hypothetical protein
MPSGPFEVGDRDGVLRCFDATAGSVYAWICRLIGGESGAAALLAAVYLRLDDQRTLGGPASVDGLRLEATAFAVAASTSDSAEAAPRVLEAAVADLAIRQHRDPSEIAAIVGVSLADLDRRIADVRSRYGTGAAGSSPIFDGGWLDDIARSTARRAIEDGHVDPLRPPAPRAPAGTERRDPSTPAVSGGSGGRSRRTVVIALAAVATLLIGVSWWTSDSDHSSAPDGTPLDLGSPASNATTTDATDPPSTVRVVTTSETTEPSTSVPYAGVPLRLSPGYTIQTPVGMEPTGLYESPADESAQDLTEADAWLQLWAEPEASRVTGRWIAMSTRGTDDSIGYVRAGFTRVAGENFVGLRQVHPDGVIELELRITRVSRVIGVNISSFGVPEADLERVAVSLVHFQPPTTVPSQQLLAAAFEPSPAVQDVMRGMELLRSGPAWCCGVYSAPSPPVASRTLTFSAVDDPEQRQWLSVATSDGIMETGLDRFLVERSSDPSAPTNPTATTMVGDRVVHVSGSTWMDGNRLMTNNTAWWIERGRTISVSASMSLTDLLAVVATARLATSEEWLQLNEQIALRPTISYHDPFADDTINIGTVVLDDGSNWSLVVDGGAQHGQLTVNGGSLGGQNTSGAILPNDGRDGVVEYDSIDATGLIIVLHDVVDSPAQVRVTVPGRDPTVVPLVQIDGTNVWMGFDAFAQMPPYSIEQIDATGAVVRFLTT